MWAGSLRGVNRYAVSAGKWKYFYGPRWLPGQSFDAGQHAESVAAVAVGVALSGASGGGDGCVIVTDNGLSVIGFGKWTMEEKASSFQSIVYPRHFRMGLTADCGLQTFGNVSSYQKKSNDNDGLWTSLYVASQAFRYAVTKDEQVRAAACPCFLNNACTYAWGDVLPRTGCLELH